MARIRALDSSLRGQITTGSFIDSPVAAIRELIDNSLDAGAKSITIVIDNDTGGLNYTMVTDDGEGVKKEDIDSMCLNHTTSKITGVEDFDKCNTLGFRGQALHYLAHLTNGNMCIGTRHRDEPIGWKWTVDAQGKIENSSLQRISSKSGTNIVMNGFFDKYPVRKKILTQNCSRIKLKLKELVFKYAMIHRDVRFELKRLDAFRKVANPTGEPHIIPTNLSRCDLLQDESKAPILSGNVSFDDSLSFEYLIQLQLDCSRINTSFGKILSVNKRLMNLSIGVGKDINKLILVPSSKTLGFLYQMFGLLKF